VDQRAKDLIAHGDDLFGKRIALMSLWQEQADNFYCERADFTVNRSLGMDFASILTTSYPLLCRRDLTNLVSTMLRPNDKDWFEVSVMRDDRIDSAGKKWLEWASTIQRRAMYDPASMFHIASSQGDADFVTFGQSVKTIELNRERDALLYRCWHLRDTVWAENYKGQVDTVHRKAKPTVRQFCKEFPEYCRNSPKIQEKLEKDPYGQIEYRHIVMPSDDYDYQSDEIVKTNRLKHPYVSIYIDVDNQAVIEEAGLWNKRYVIPRWQTVSGSQYAYSPATVCALPDARLIQAFTLILLEAGEKAVTPPMVTPGGVIRSDTNLFAGGITTYDAEYDEKSGEVLRVIPHDYSGLQFGKEMREDIKMMINNAFYLNKINLPPIGKEMTAFEVGQRVTEYVRNAMPIFGPMEMEENGATCEMTFDLLHRAGTFGGFLDMPQSLRGQDIQFKFQSPLHAAIEAQKGTEFMQAKAMLAEAAALDGGVVNMLDVRTAMRDALEGVGTPAKWLRDPGTMADMDKVAAQQAKTQQLLQTMGQGADVATKLGNAQTALSGMPARTTAQAVPQQM
jgi:hypothetical protein